MLTHEDRHGCIAAARSFLFVPGDRPERFDKAAAANPDVIILDLEDAVPDRAKNDARANVANWLRMGHQAVIRINDATSPWHDDDLSLGVLPGVIGLMLPKAEAGEALSRVAVVSPIIALVETACGVAGLSEVIGTAGVVRLAFGTVDLALDLDTSDDNVIRTLGTLLVVASRAARAPSPIDGVTLETKNPLIVEQETRESRARGFGAKLCIHPAQVDAVHAGLRPSAAAIEHALRVVEADRTSGGAATTVNGVMVDRPLVAQASRTLAAAGLSPGS